PQCLYGEQATSVPAVRDLVIEQPMQQVPFLRQDTERGTFGRTRDALSPYLVGRQDLAGGERESMRVDLDDTRFSGAHHLRQVLIDWAKFRRRQVTLGGQRVDCALRLVLPYQDVQVAHVARFAPRPDRCHQVAGALEEQWNDVRAVQCDDDSQELVALPMASHQMLAIYAFEDSGRMLLRCEVGCLRHRK